MFFGSDSNCPPFSQLIGEYVKRSNNHQALLAALKDVNNMIQKAAKLRGKISKLNTNSVFLTRVRSFVKLAGRRLVSWQLAGTQSSRTTSIRCSRSSRRGTRWRATAQAPAAATRNPRRSNLNTHNEAEACSHFATVAQHCNRSPFTFNVQRNRKNLRIQRTAARST